MNEIKFRGKRKDNNEWVYGYFYKQEAPLQCIQSENTNSKDEQSFIIYAGFADWNMPRPMYQVEVIPETVAPYIGKKDKCGKEIYRDDILATSNDDPQYDIWSKKDFGYTKVIWNNKSSSYLGDNWTWVCDNKKGESIYGLEFVEVIGNIHEPLTNK
ncbi:hypothetical protein FDA33_09975 [Clostridium botulinum]|nr:YopX family protein [Clostridium botulinum]NFH90519.1 hypothetical protein [Clostridium botulinum]NFI19537.1 hypothetical protein [Clostridium botulinum]NFN06139.1 hypothetical protein [Clostridium botulinum]NFN19464.1 hypothetical protein [Clostridium botulinum]NFN36829.1 hypothetical protein [Clostridium botulinum]